MSSPRLRLCLQLCFVSISPLPCPVFMESTLFLAQDESSSAHAHCGNVFDKNINRKKKTEERENQYKATLCRRDGVLP